MKIRTLLEFEEAMDNAIAWRRKELSYIKSQIGGFDPRTAFYIRAGIALLYAHWEGYVREAAQIFVHFVKGKRPLYKQLSQGLLGLALRREIHEMLATTKSGRRGALAIRIRDKLDERASLDATAASATKSNLSSDVLREIIDTLGLDYTPFVPLEHTIDHDLVWRRNQVAHGEGLRLNEDEYTQIHEKTLRLLEIFQEQVAGSARGSKYLVTT